MSISISLEKEALKELRFLAIINKNKGLTEPGNLLNWAIYRWAAAPWRPMHERQIELGSRGVLFGLCTATPILRTCSMKQKKERVATPQIAFQKRARVLVTKTMMSICMASRDSANYNSVHDGWGHLHVRL